MTQQGFPPMPKINGDISIILDVYMDSSLRFGNPPMNEEYGDTDRLCELGKRALDLVISTTLFLKKPPITAEDLNTQRETFLSDEILSNWLDSYNLKKEFRYNPQLIEDTKLPEAYRRFFYTLIGALYFRNGLPDIQKWIGPLVDPEAASQIAQPPFSPISAPIPGLPAQVPSWSAAAPPPPASSPPPMPPNSLPPPGQVDMSGIQIISLAMINQMAQQKGMSIEYRARQTGPPHAPTWHATVEINGQEYGSGDGKTSKAAKEKAGTMAYYAIGWGIRT